MATGDLKYFPAVVFLIILLIGPACVTGQPNARLLEKKKSRLEKSIEYADYLIEDAQKQKDATLQDLALLQAKIDIRKQLIDNFLQEQSLTFDTIFDHMLRINEINNQLNELRDEYALMINSAYRNQNSYKRLLFVLSSGNLNQAYSRLSYYKHYARQRNAQIEYINSVEANYFVEVDKLEKKVTENEHLIENLNEEYALLEEEVNLKDSIIQNLNDQMKQLAAEQQQNKKSALALKTRIQRIINEEGMDNSVASVNQELLSTPTPEEKVYSEGFSQNYGKLPWPLQRGIVSAEFGEQSHPDLREVKIKNNGINFLTHKGAMARAVFRGEVTRVLSVPNFNHVVILRHGDFLSVYSNLAKVFVEPGMTVETKQDIGMVFTDAENKKTELHFEIWNGKELQDPIIWLAPEVNDETHLQNNR